MSETMLFNSEYLTDTSYVLPDTIVEWCREMSLSTTFSFDHIATSLCFLTEKYGWTAEKAMHFIENDPQYVGRILTIIKEKRELDNIFTNHIVSKCFPQHLLEKSGLQKYTTETGITVITIVYNAETKDGWLDAISSVPIRIDPLENYEYGLPENPIHNNQ